ncbi:MAG: DUF1801 domain-containing protein [Peptococcaceae bacterium]|jgi:uncharacterized protein YdhG (YjbR/CyaY superfamily)|nr:DUF1801 domain-containing protein [Peptococcaceae bacterium]
MQGKRATTVAEYIHMAPKDGQPLLQELYSLLKEVAPSAQEAIKWGNPFFVEPRFLFAFSAHKAHLSFAPGPDAMEAFRDELAQHKTTKHFLQVPYSQPLPAALIRKMATYRVKAVKARKDDSFW